MAHLPCYSVNSIRVHSYSIDCTFLLSVESMREREVSEQRKITNTCKSDTGSSNEAIDSNERLMKGGLRRRPLLMTLADRIKWVWMRDSSALEL